MARQEVAQVLPPVPGAMSLARMPAQRSVRE